MNYKELINEKILKAYTELLSDIIYIYNDNKIDMTKKNLLSELPGIRELKKSEVDIILSNSIELTKIKYNINVSKKVSD